MGSNVSVPALAQIELVVGEHTNHVVALGSSAALKHAIWALLENGAKKRPLYSGLFFLRECLVMFRSVNEMHRSRDLQQ